MTQLNRSLFFLILSCLVLFLTACGGKSSSAPVALTQFTRGAFLTQAQVVSDLSTTPIKSSATGTASFTLDTDTRQFSGTLVITGMTHVISSVEIHDGDVGSNGDVVLPLFQTTPGVWTVVTPTYPAQFDVDRFKAAGYFINVHTTANPAGEIRGQLMSYADNIQPLFDQYCVDCHNSNGQAANTGLFLNTVDSYRLLVNQPATSSTATGIRVTPLDPTHSVLYERISGAGLPAGAAQMPLLKPPLSAHDQNLIKSWIDMGARND